MSDTAFLDSHAPAEAIDVYSLRSLKKLAPYRRPEPLKSSWQVFNTFALYGLFWWLAYLSLSVSYGLTLLCSTVCGLMVARMFAIQHDCGHGSLYKSRRIQNLIGTCCSLFTLIPFHYWRKVHAVHHADLGNLDRRSPGEFPMLTVREFAQASPAKQRFYRIMRNPWVLMLIIPAAMFFLSFRTPRTTSEFTSFEKNSVYLTDLALLALIAGLSSLVGFWNVCLIQVPIHLVMGTIAVWMFYVQHHYENTYWQWEGELNFFEAAIRGSSFIPLPRFFQWATGNSGFHYIHHLAPLIPNYSLERCHNDNPLFHEHITTLSLRESLRSLSMALWDEDLGRLISFREAEEGARDEGRGARDGNKTEASLAQP